MLRDDDDDDESSDGSSSSDEDQSDTDDHDEANGSFDPRIADVLIVKLLLNRITVPLGDQEMALPIEVINMILDHAEYWPHSTTNVHYNNLQVRAGHPNGDNKFLVCHVDEASEKTRHTGGGLELTRPHSQIRCRPLGFLENDFPSPESAGGADPITSPLRKAFDPDVFQDYIAKRWNFPAVLANPCRRIVFTIVSHDQGWGGDPYSRGTYRASWTWFEVGLERFDAGSGKKEEHKEQGEAKDRMGSPTTKEETEPEVQQRVFTKEKLRTVLPEVMGDGETLHHPLHPVEELMIQRNVTADHDHREHHVVWSYDDGIDAGSPVAQEALGAKGRGLGTGNGQFVRDLKLGDVVTVWAKARFPQWVNYVEEVKVDIYWAI